MELLLYFCAQFVWFLQSSLSYCLLVFKFELCNIGCITLDLVEIYEPTSWET